MEKILPAIVTLKSGKQLNVAKLGIGPAILFLHGFPGTWYSWRSQLNALSDLDYQAIAPDLRGYGGSDRPGDWSSYSTVQIVGDLVDLLDVLSIDKVFLVGHDFGAIVAWHFCLLRPDRVKAMVNTSVACMFNDPSVSPLSAYKAKYGDDFYVCRFQNPKKVNDELSSCDPQNVVRGFYRFFGGPTAPSLVRNEGFDKEFSGSCQIPPWLHMKDIKHYADTFQKTGYIGGLNYYRAMNHTWELMAAYTGVKITTPVKLVVGDLDFAYNLDGVKEYIHNGGLKNDVPNVEVNVWPGVCHFLNEQEPDKLSDLIYDYFKNFK